MALLEKLPLLLFKERWKVRKQKAGEKESLRSLEELPDSLTFLTLPATGTSFNWEVEHSSKKCAKHI